MTIRITAEMLMESGHKQDSQCFLTFCQEWPEGAEVTEANLERAIELGLDWEGAGVCLPLPTSKAYFKATARARRAYFGAVTPSRQAYWDSPLWNYRRAAKEDAYVEVRAAAREVFEKVAIEAARNIISQLNKCQIVQS